MSTRQDYEDGRKRREQAERFVAAWRERYGGGPVAERELLRLAQELGLNEMLGDGGDQESYLHNALMRLFGQVRAGARVIFAWDDDLPRGFKLTSADLLVATRVVTEYDAGRYQEVEVEWPAVDNWRSELRLMGYSEFYPFGCNYYQDLPIRFYTRNSATGYGDPAVPPFIVDVPLNHYSHDPVLSNRSKVLAPTPPAVAARRPVP